MVRWLSGGHDAMTHQESSAQARAVHHDDVMVKVLDLAPKSGNPGHADDLVRQVREALGQGQAVVLVNWEPEMPMRWGWNDRDLADITGGITTNGGISLEKHVQWQCKCFEPQCSGCS